MSVTMMSRFMLNLHRTATDKSRNYSTSSTDFGSVASTGMVFTSRFGTTGLPTATAHTESEGATLTNSPRDEFELRAM